MQLNQVLVSVIDFPVSDVEVIAGFETAFGLFRNTRSPKGFSWRKYRLCLCRFCMVISIQYRCSWGCSCCRIRRFSILEESRQLILFLFEEAQSDFPRAQWNWLGGHNLCFIRPFIETIPHTQVKFNSSLSNYC